MGMHDGRPVEGETPPREVEIKFAFDDQALPLIQAMLDSLGAPVHTAALVSTYFDDDDLSLRQAGLTLRVREADGLFVQTIKAGEGGGLFDRGEYEGPVAGPAPDLDAAGRTPFRKAFGRAGPLRPVFVNRVDRQIRTVTDRGGVVEISLDLGETEGADGARAPVRQLELELKRGRPAVLFRLARALAAAAPLRLTLQTKADLGYGLLAQDPALKPDRGAMEDHMTAGEALQSVARGELTRLLIHALAVRENRDSEALHQLRVGLRRLRAALSLFKPLLDEAEAGRVKAELKWLAGQLDEGRDLDVFMAETFEPAVEILGADPGLDALGDQVRRATSKAYDQAVAALNSDRGRALPLLVAEWIEAGAWLTSRRAGRAAARDQPAVDLARHALAKARRKVKRRGAGLDALGPEQRHRLRIAAKGLRYGLSFFAPLFPRKRGQAFGRRLAALQDSLGALNDIAIARRRAQRLSAGAPPAAATAAGLVVGLRVADTAGLLDKVAGQFAALIDARAPWKGKT